MPGSSNSECAVPFPSATKATINSGSFPNGLRDGSCRWRIAACLRCTGAFPVGSRRSSTDRSFSRRRRFSSPVHRQARCPMPTPARHWMPPPCEGALVEHSSIETKAPRFGSEDRVRWIVAGLALLCHQQFAAGRTLATAQPRSPRDLPPGHGLEISASFTSGFRRQSGVPLRRHAQSQALV